MKALHYTPDDAEPTGEFSWPKLWGLVIVTLSPGPVVLWYLEQGPDDIPWWAPMVITLFLALLGVGLYRRRMLGLFDRVSEAGVDRLRGGGTDPR